MNTQKTTYKRVTTNGKKNILSVVKPFVLLRRSNRISGTDAADERSQRFLYQHILTLQANGLVVCGSSNAHKDTLIRPEQRHKPFLFNVQKRISTMNAKLYGSTEKERKDHMKKCIDGTCGAIMFYFDDDLNIRCCGTTEDGYEANLLQLLSSASMTARNAVEEVLW